MGKLPKRALKSMTMDNSLEFAKQTVRRKTFWVQTYFCDPSASWQKEGVENSNSWLRGDLTRKTDLYKVTQEEFDEIILNHNLKPIKCLHWMSPLQAFNQNLNDQRVALHA